MSKHLLIKSPPTIGYSGGVVMTAKDGKEHILHADTILCDVNMSLRTIETKTLRNKANEFIPVGIAFLWGRPLMRYITVI